MPTPCLQCHSPFDVTPDDLAFYDKISPTFAGKKYPIPPPKLCPLCRQQRRLSFRNERKLYKRKCDLSGREILSIYSPDKPYKVYDQPEWWSDKWDPMVYGRDFDFSKPFFPQFRALYEAVPRVSLHTTNAENSTYTNYTLNAKNCYLLFGSGNAEDVMFGKYVSFSKDVVDALAVYSSELCYEIIASDRCYGCRFVTNCRSCTSSLMLEDCSACTDCIACYGLRNKQYFILNKQYTKEQYEKIAKEYEYLTPAKIQLMRSKLNELKKTLPHIASHIYASEDCTGDAVFNSKNCQFAYDVKESENCKYLHNSPKCLETYDAVYCAPDGLQFCYNLTSCVGTNLMVGFFVWYCDEVRYSMDCLNARNLFGCVGLRNKQYCVFNKQYTKEEYETLVGRIIEHMMKATPPSGGQASEWGEFFPYSLTPCAYNEAVGHEYFPLTKEQAVALGASWKEEDPLPQRPNSDYFTPAEDIRDVSENITTKTLKCETSGREFRITPQEFKFYQKMKLPVPRRHPDQRHYDRLAQHNAHRLWDRACAKCGKTTPTAIPPENPAIVYCEGCYLKEAY